MNCIACVDDRLGILFNHRRVSLDLAIAQDIAQWTQNTTLYMDHYSSELFQGVELHHMMLDSHLPKTTLAGWQFIEQQPIPTTFHSGDQWLIYYFNRRYPSDVQLPMDLNHDACWSIVEATSFVGQAHDKITRVLYRYVAHPKHCPQSMHHKAINPQYHV